MVVVCVLGTMFFSSSKVEYTPPEPEIITKEVKVDALEQAIVDAQAAKKTEIEAVAQKAYDEAYDREMKKIESAVRKEYGEQNDAVIEALDKETKEY